MVTKETKAKVLKQLNDLVNELDVNIHTKENYTKADFELFNSIMDVFYKVDKNY